MEACVRNVEIDKLLKACSPSRLDNLVRKICPKYKRDNSKPSQIYEEIHNLAVSIILARLRKVGIEAEAEIALENGVVDIRVKRGNEPVAIVEVKTGKVKLMQSAAYAYMTGRPVFVAEMRTGNVTKITPDIARLLLERYLGLLKDIKEVRDGPIIPNSACRFCVADCEYSNGKNLRNPDPIRNLFDVLDNIDEVVEKLIEGIRAEINGNGLKKENLN
ncbi:hypothetical protein AFULGI_00005890 [Archaeoglobus fulgidus DSM 8774]|uniref:Uncharacterized protein n=1 Tax=Archaeoglobus fulgidus DSM 8774 TaxID=1344584 RepID=A0A075WAH2_ARCFL|nr:hypothetical protein [Archaeoglobus fulgidus]AIG97390.1 hypothetical protein AFULGI_00005890 [Archaeoglobus fulgidus DSM 8774]